MDVLIEYLSVGFFQRALLAGLILGLLTGLLGAFSLMRQSSFFGDAIAHSSLAGVALGLFFGMSPIFSAFVYAILVALFLPWLKKFLNFSYDNVLGIVLPFSMGLGIFIFSLLPGYQPELLSFLFGSMLTISWSDVWMVLGLTVVVSALVIWKYARFLLVSMDQAYSQLVGTKVRSLELFYQLMLAVTIIAGVKLVGIILINALLVVPASIAKIWSRSLNQFVLLSVGVSMVLIMTGLLVSLLVNAPPGSTIAVVSGVVFFANALVSKVISR